MMLEYKRPGIFYGFKDVRGLLMRQKVDPTLNLFSGWFCAIYENVLFIQLIHIVFSSLCLQ